ncbi:MAG TPA: phosphate uptake regulator PhoU [Candidatus Caldiarchaeum subterraneum]|uniref:Phosphate uptake regulator PhoU n=1 Tax=Caldiarchaeum subterraneum TaxID=311458 RepID=A0A833EC52_CALS0|nr:phosphate uptake regulator PhoU [Candidatus Caldarchaeum subterraneum]
MAVKPLVVILRIYIGIYVVYTVQYIRRLQKVGTNTLTVSLPHEWVKKMKLKPGDNVTVAESPDGTLRITVENKPVSLSLACSFDVENFQDPDLLSRLVIAAYLQGFEGIKIVGGDGVPENLQERLSDVIDILPGVEIVEQTYRRILMQSFIDPHKFPIETLIKRIQIMITTMLNNLGEAFSSGKHELLDEIGGFEEKIDELYFLCIRQIFVRIKMGILGELHPNSYVQAVGDRLIVLALEEISDSIQMAALEAKFLTRYKISENVVNEILKLHEVVQVLFGKTMKALFSLDVWLANEVIEQTRKYFEEHFKLREEIIENMDNLRVAVGVRSIIWNLINIARNCKIISEVTINRFVRTPSRLVSVESI